VATSLAASIWLGVIAAIASAAFAAFLIPVREPIVAGADAAG
jgi:hypothetical protein